MAGLILGIRDREPSGVLVDAIRAGRVAGLLWFRDALGPDVEEARERIARVRGMWPPETPCLFASDEEGGLIQQLSGLRDPDGATWPRLPSARALGRGGDPSIAFAHGREIGRRMRRLGLDVTLAPVVDLDAGPGSSVLGTRCFGPEPAGVVRIAGAWLRGLAATGVRACLKHYPGHGATRRDSHHDLPRIERDVDAARHLLPFVEIARGWHAEDGPAPAVLTAHILREPAMLPATLDPEVLAAIPATLGPVWTDSLDMGALSAWGDLEARALAAATAGADLLVVGWEVEEGLALAGRLDPAPSAKLSAWSAPRSMPLLPEEWGFDEVVRAAAAGLRILRDAPIPAGEWDWILPERFGAYGAVAQPDAGRVGKRRIAEVLRYTPGEGLSLERALAAHPARPALVGWIHRGPEDVETGRLLGMHWPRARAVAHLLDEPEAEGVPRVWSAGACGFGEGEIAALRDRWNAVSVEGNAN